MVAKLIVPNLDAMIAATDLSKENHILFCCAPNGFVYLNAL